MTLKKRYQINMEQQTECIKKLLEVAATLLFNAEKIAADTLKSVHYQEFKATMEIIRLQITEWYNRLATRGGEIC